MARKKRAGLGLVLERFSLKATKATGTSGAFVIALAVLIVWAISGPLFRFSDTWQLVINTGTTIVTFLMVFLIQRTQNKDALAITSEAQRDCRRDRGSQQSANRCRGPYRSRD